MVKMPPLAVAQSPSPNMPSTETITFESSPISLTFANQPDLLSGEVDDEEEDGWANVRAATEQVSNFSIADDDDEEDLL